MELITTILLGIGLSMDAFAASVCKGLALGKVSCFKLLIPGLWFGAFQALMPLIGYFLGSKFYTYIESFDHWIAFILLSLIGINMLREAFLNEPEETDSSLGFKSMLIMAIATSIDALAVGIALAMDRSTDIVSSIVIIGLTTFILSTIGCKIGCIFGSKYKKKAEITGGVILIALGIKILIEHSFGL